MSICLSGRKRLRDEKRFRIDCVRVYPGRAVDQVLGLLAASAVAQLQWALERIVLTRMAQEEPPSRSVKNDSTCLAGAPQAMPSDRDGLPRVGYSTYSR